MRAPALIPLFAFLTSLSSACDRAGSAATQPVGWDSQVALPEIEDESPDPHVLEVHLEASVSDVEIIPGTKTAAWTFGGTLPGPLLRATAGDRLIVHFENNLPEPTTIHWHGVRVPAAMDGAPGHTQPEIQPGESFDYDFIVPDAGTFWYHPHFESATQVGNGLYGALIVDPAEPEPEGLGDELVLVLSDIGLEDDGSLKGHDAAGDLGGLFGREGTHMLVNGRHLPTVLARAGLRQRWRIINAAKSRYFQLAMAGQNFTVIGGDGGWNAAPYETDTLLIVPGSRMDVVWTPNAAPGQSLDVRWIPYDRGYGSTEFRPEEQVLRVAMSPQPLASSPPLPDTSRIIEALDPQGATPVNLELTLMQKSELEIDLGINGVPAWEAEPIDAAVGETQLWSVSNTMDWSHPFHLHGFFFQVVDAEGRPEEPIGWRDTVDVARDETRHFLVRYDNRPGTWMYHCHVLDHADMGMMGMVELRR